MGARACACVRACVRACVHACVRACVCACVRACVRYHVHVCEQKHHHLLHTSSMLGEQSAGLCTRGSLRQNLTDLKITTYSWVTPKNIERVEDTFRVRSTPTPGHSGHSCPSTSACRAPVFSIFEFPSLSGVWGCVLALLCFCAVSKCVITLYVGVDDTVVSWLAQTGLSCYQGLFAQHHVTSDLLLALDAEALEKIGVQSWGHRCVLLRAVAGRRKDLAADGSCAAQSEAEDGGVGGLRGARKRGGERDKSAATAGAAAGSLHDVYLQIENLKLHFESQVEQLNSEMQALKAGNDTQKPHTHTHTHKHTHTHTHLHIYLSIDIYFFVTHTHTHICVYI